jgi:hypothetical protein
MTKVDVSYQFAVPFQESWTASIEALHGVYGLQAVRLSPQLDSLAITYDASRLGLDDVDRCLRDAGLPVLPRQSAPATSSPA